MKTYMRTAIAAVLLALPAASIASPIHESREVSADARIDISNVKGTVTVSAWDKNEVAISGELGEGAKGLTVEGGGAHLTIKVEPPDKHGWGSWGADSRMSDTDLEIKVPRGAELKIDVVSADVTTSGVAGRLTSVNAVSGKVRIDSLAKELEIDSVSGDVEVAGKAERGHLETVSGDIRARGLSGQLKFETVSGGIDAEASTYRELTAGSVSGDINLRGTPDKSARLDVETMSGDVHVYLPSSASAHLRAESFSGHMHSDFGRVVEKEHGPGSSLDATIGAGDARINVQTFSGDVEIRSN